MFRTGSWVKNAMFLRENGNKEDGTPQTSGNVDGEIMRRDILPSKCRTQAPTGTSCEVVLTMGSWEDSELHNGTDFRAS